MRQQPIANAFKHAFNGTVHFILRDRNGRIHFTAALFVTAAGFYFSITATEWCILLLCMAIVISFEMMNHAVETICNVVHEAHHPLIKTVKDVSAAAVLCSAIASMLVGLIIFIPKIFPSL
jgi:diacylglycerol kinase